MRGGRERKLAVMSVLGAKPLEFGGDGEHRYARNKVPRGADYSCRDILNELEDRD